MRLFFIVIITLLFPLSNTSYVTTVITTPAKVVVVKKLPKNHKIVFVKGQRYYTWNGKHNIKTNNGYVVVRF
ncbi:DUF6515 family protein [Lutibacter sp.]|uniref:DUF6515 family protein n=1 Tax=Lutibacter sp. TaxID=1925666 RepID=UPI003562EC78